MVNMVNKVNTVNMVKPGAAGKPAATRTNRGSCQLGLGTTSKWTGLQGHIQIISCYQACWRVTQSVIQ